MSACTQPWEHQSAAAHQWAFTTLLAGLVAALYAPVLAGLISDWQNDPNYSHGFIVVLFSAWLIWRGRRGAEAVALAPSNYGLVGMAVGIGLLVVGTLGAELFVTRFSLLALLAGMVVFLAGWEMLQLVSFPLGYLVFAIPLPAILYYQLTFPLQLQASQLAGGLLDLLRVPAIREGNLLILPNYTLEVADACSGIRSLFSLLALAVAYGHLLESRLWKRIVLVGGMVPVAVISNSLRVVGTGVLTYLAGPRAAEGFFHLFSGWLVFLVSLVFLLFLHRTLRLVDRGMRRS